MANLCVVTERKYSGGRDHFWEFVFQPIHIVFDIRSVFFDLFRRETPSVLGMTREAVYKDDADQN